MDPLVDDLANKLEAWLESLIMMAPNIGAAIAVLLGFWLLSRLVCRVTRRIMARVTSHQTLAELVDHLVRFVVLAVGLVIALQILDLDKAATTFLAGAGIIGLALGFAFQDLTANFISGVAMAVQRPLQVGDLIESNGVFGNIEHIQLRCTYLRTLEGQRVMIPNQKIYQEILTNYSDLGKRRVDIEVGVSYGDDLAKARRLALEAVEALDRLDGTAVELYYTGFGESSIDFVVRFWIRFENSRQADYLAARSEAVMAIKRAFDQGDVTIPFPIRTLDFGALGGEPLRDHLEPLSPNTNRRASQ